MADDTIVLDPANADNSGADKSQGQDTLAGQDNVVATQGADTLDAQGNDTISGGDADKDAPGYWPDTWRERLAKGDEKKLKELQRFRSIEDRDKSYDEMRKKLSSGELKAKLAPDATDEQVAAWRKDNGIPEKPDGYLEKLPGGLVIGSEEMPVYLPFAEIALEENVSPQAMGRLIAKVAAQQEEQIAAQSDADKAFKQTAEDALRAEWGSEYRGNLNSIMSFLDSAPPTDDGSPLKGLLMGARLADGTLFGNNPAALKWLASLAQDANPAGFVQPNAGASQLNAVEDEINGIRKVMRESRHIYDKDEKMQERFRILLTAQEKLRK